MSEIVQQKPVKRRRKREKDPNAPKRPRSAYILFCADKRGEAKQRDPEAGATDILRMLGQMWSELTPEDKAPWVAKADADKERYKAERMHYTPPPKPRGKKKKDPLAPKRACSAYIFFGQAIREQIKAEMPDAKNTEILKETGARWQKLDEQEKEVYVRQAAADKERYEREMAAYNVQQHERNRALQAQQAQMQANAAAAAAQHRVMSTIGLHQDDHHYAVQMDQAQQEYRPPPHPQHPHPHAHYGF